jgi:hypothetical protein
MPRHDANLPLRRVVSDLAALHSDDLDAVLEKFGAEERESILALMQDYAAQFDAQPVTPKPTQAHDLSRLSPWLARRAGDGEMFDCTMTAQARRLLRDCAMRLHPAGQAAGTGSQTDLRGQPLSPGRA